MWISKKNLEKKMTKARLEFLVEESSAIRERHQWEDIEKLKKDVKKLKKAIKNGW